MTCYHMISEDVVIYIVEQIIYIPRNRYDLDIALELWFRDEDRAIKKYGHISYWNIRNVSDLGQLMDGDYRAYRSYTSRCKNFNEKLHWNTSHVTNLADMFYGCEKFNQPLNFDTGNVIHMHDMFKGCKSYKQPTNFNTAKVTQDRRGSNWLVEFCLSHNY